MEELLIKLRKERMELHGKIIKLDKFRGTDEWNKLSVAHKQLLDIQLQSMRTYLEALIGRCLDIEEHLNDKANDKKPVENESKENDNEDKDDDIHQVNVIILGLGDLNE